MKYQQLTSEDRYILAALRRQGISISAIAEELGKHRSTIYREINRNSCHIIDGSYRPDADHVEIRISQTMILH